jgi:hypothetical protein
VRLQSEVPPIARQKLRDVVDPLEQYRRTAVDLTGRRRFDDLGVSKQRVAEWREWPRRSGF